MSESAWGGRFQEELAEAAARFSASVDVDKRLAPIDIEGSLAHVRMLGRCGVLPASDVERIEQGLQALAARVEAGDFSWDAKHEDVHMNLEVALTAEIGESGAKLHTARSRNDQVATDMRLWTKRACQGIRRSIDALIATLVARGIEELDVLMPGYTHLQRAQPVRLTHHLLAWCEMLERDAGRLRDAEARMDECPLGAGALATTTFAIDRKQSAAALGFARPTRNSLDTVADRDFLVEALSALSLCAVHLSRIAEELVLWSTQEFSFVTMSDAFATGSSMMPQKKNPDMAELIRGKCGRVVGDLVALLITLKGLPLSYNRDLQEDKAPVFQSFDTLSDCLEVMRGMVESLHFRADRMQAALREGFVNATEIADYLAAKGVPFRHAHHVSGRLVALALSRAQTLEELSLDDYKGEDAHFEADIFEAIRAEVAVERRDVEGGPAKARVLHALGESLDRLATRGYDTSALRSAWKARH